MKEDFINKLKTRADEVNSIVCMGMDPILERIPLKGDTDEVIVKFYTEILNTMVAEDVMPAIVKPNIAFYEQYGFKGLKALKKIIDSYKDENIPVLLDVKRGDIGKTSRAYAKASFELWGADAITVSPYMGSDSVGPFMEYSEKKGVYVLNRTSNKGATDFQNLKTDNRPLYLRVSEKIVEWSRSYGNVGAVVGATSLDELREISKFYVRSGQEIPLLIPGVGAQGGSATEVVGVLKKTNNELKIHRINSSSGINYAYEKEKTDDYAGAAVRAIGKLNKEINLS